MAILREIEAQSDSSLVPFRNKDYVDPTFLLKLDIINN